MREAFASWYPLAEEDRRRAYREGLVVLDTNVLLSLYRFNPAARQEVLGLLGKVAVRLWMPHQVGLEFHRNRLKVIHDAVEEQLQLDAALTKARRELEQTLRAAQARIGLRDAPLTGALGRAFEILDEQVARVQPEERLSLDQAISDDPVLDAVTSLYAGRVGRPFSSERRKQEEATGKRRIENQVPPGYLDAKKGDPLGDYFIWRQVLDEAAERKLPILLVTQERKLDWYYHVHGRTIGARRELINEMQSEAGVQLCLVSLESFLTQAPAYLETSVSAETVREAHTLPRERHVAVLREAAVFQRKAAKAMAAKGWLVVGEYRVGESGSSRLATYTVDLAVPFVTDPPPHDPVDYTKRPRDLIEFIAFELKPGIPNTKNLRNRVHELIALTALHRGPVVLLTQDRWPLPADLALFREKYVCGWGQYPKFQALTLDDLEQGNFELPTQGIHEASFRESDEPPGIEY